MLPIITFAFNTVNAKSSKSILLRNSLQKFIVPFEKNCQKVF